MPDEPPAFPKPRTRGGYREAARPSEVTRPPVIVTRPDPVAPEGSPPTDANAYAKRPSAPSPELARELLAPLDVERTYWQRHRFFYRHPRISATGLLVGSVLLTGPSLASHGAYVSTRGLILGAAFGLSGVWVLVAGAPLERDGRPPGWWQAGFFGCMAAGLALGLTLSAVL